MERRCPRRKQTELMARALVQTRSFFSSTLAGLANNQFATGGLAVLAGGAGLALARTVSRITWDGIVRRVVVRAEFDSRDDSYRWLVAWLSQHPHYATTKRSISTNTSFPSPFSLFLSPSPFSANRLKQVFRANISAAHWRVVDRLGRRQNTEAAGRDAGALWNQPHAASGQLDYSRSQQGGRREIVGA